LPTNANLPAVVNDKPPLLRFIALVYWALGIGLAIVDGTDPGPWFPRYQHTFDYPFGPVALVCVVISLETFALYGVLRWLPVPARWRWAAGTVLSAGAVTWLVFHMWLDAAGYAYTNLSYMLLVFVSLLIADLIMIIKTGLSRRTSAQPGNAA
jgi:hypothetical protein